MNSSLVPLSPWGRGFRGEGRGPQLLPVGTLILACLVISRPVLAADPAPVTLFTAGEGGYASYRIPALVVTGKGTLLAFGEARKTASDWAEIDLLIRRSNDGVVWTAPETVGPTPADLVRNPLAP